MRTSRSLFSIKTALVVSMVALVFFVRLYFVRAWGSPLPFWDQWDAEASGLYSPWLRGVFDWHSIFASHNEHRIALTWLTDLGLFELFGRWNIWAQLVLNALLHALTAGVVLHLFRHLCSAKARVVFALGIAVLFITVAGWQNALWGFQSQFYYSNLFAVLAIGGLVATTPLSLPWWLGWVAAFLSLFSNAGGLLAPIAVMLVGGTAWIGGQRSPRELVDLGLIGMIVACGFVLHVDPPYHAPLHAHTVAQFVSMLGRCLAWPHVQQGWLCMILQLPMLLLLIARRKERQSLHHLDWIALTLVLLGCLQAAAIAYSRGAGLVLQGPLSRYQDAFLLGVSGQLYAAISLAIAWKPGRLVALGWIGVLAAGLISLTEVNLALQLPRKRALDRIGVEAIRSYQANKDEAPLFESLARQAMHPSDPAAVRRVLDDPMLVSVLPAELTAPPGSSVSFLPWIVRQSAIFAFVAVVFFLALLGPAYRSGSKSS